MAELYRKRALKNIKSFFWTQDGDKHALNMSFDKGDGVKGIIAEILRQFSKNAMEHINDIIGYDVTTLTHSDFKEKTYKLEELQNLCKGLYAFVQYHQ